MSIFEFPEPLKSVVSLPDLIAYVDENEGKNDFNNGWVPTFRAIINWVGAQTDEDFKTIKKSRNQLDRHEVAKFSGVSKSNLTQNWFVRKALLIVDEDLRSKGILFAEVSDTKGLDDSGEPEPNKREQLMSQRMQSLEKQVATISAERDMLKVQNKRFRTIEAILMETGRLPR